VTKNNGFRILLIDLLALLHNYNQLWQLTINDSLRFAPFLPGLRVSSLLLRRMTNDKSLLTHWTPIWTTSVWRITLTNDLRLFYNFQAARNRSPSPAVPLLFCVIRCHGNLCLATFYLATTRPFLLVSAGTWFPNRCSAMDYSVTIYLWIKNTKQYGRNDSWPIWG
jgi:hypothetical protein